MTDFTFSPTTVSTEVEKKLAIKRLPSWMQESEQIQKYFDDVVQHWFTPEQQRSVDGYIGLRGGVNSDDTVYVHERTLDRQEYQLAPTMVSTDNVNTALAALTYSDLVDNLKYQGALTDNASRLLNGDYYSWAPPVNPDMIINYSNYYWDTTNSSGMVKPDYIVLQRDCRDGNAWSAGNHWYPVQYQDKSGITVTITKEDIMSGRFVQAQRPIIEYLKDMELYDHGRYARGSVDLVCDTLLPEDIMFRSYGDNILVDGITLAKNHRVLFTSIMNPGENNRIYKVTQELKNGKQVYGLILDSTEITADRPSGEPVLWDTIQVNNGVKYKNNVLFWNGKIWRVGQQKTKRNQYPMFVLYDKNGKRLDDVNYYPSSTFKGSHIFSIVQDSTYPVDQIYGVSVAVDRNGDNVYQNNLQTDVFTYINEGKAVNISTLRFYNIMALKQTEDQYYSEWRQVSVPTRQFCRQLIEVSSVVKNGAKVVITEYDMALVPEAGTNDYPTIRVDINGDVTSNYTITKGKIKFKDAVKEGDLITVQTHNSVETPNTDLGVYEIPTNLKNNAMNENITIINESRLVDHFMDIIVNQTGFTGSANGINNFSDTPREMDRGRKVIQHDASLVPLMVHNVNANVDIINAIEFSKNAYTQFKNKFTNLLSESYTIDMETKLPQTVAIDLIKKINVGKSDEFAFWLTGMARTDSLPQTFIPATPQYLGIVAPTAPALRKKMDIGYGIRLYNVSHSGVYSTSFSTLSSVDGTDVINNDYRDHVVYALEKMIYDSINPAFKNVDYTPLLNTIEMRPSALRGVVEYTPEEWDKIALKGFSNWVTSKAVNFKSNTDFDQTNWKTWNYSSTKYRANGQSARGSWRAIHMDHFDTMEINTKPWECLNFTSKPDWWDREYTNVAFPYSDAKETNKGERAYIDEKMFADIEAGFIRGGARKGTWAHLARKDFRKYNPIMDNGLLAAPHVAAKAGRLPLVDKAPTTGEAMSQWKFGDIGEIEFMYMNSTYYPFDVAATLYRAKPAQWANYFWNPSQFAIYTQGKYTQWLNKTTDDRLRFTSDTVVHGENGTRVLGYSMWVTDYLKYNHMDIARNYGNIVRGAGVKLSYRLGGFTKSQNLTFVSDSFGLVSQENQTIRLLKSAVKEQEVLSGLHIAYDRGDYIVSGYDASYPYLNYFKPLSSGTKHQVKINNMAFVQYETHDDTQTYEIKYDTRFDSIQAVYTFIVGYGEYLESRGWIFEELTSEGEIFDWRQMAFKFADWALGKRKTGDFVSLSPCTRTVKFAKEQGHIENVTQFSGGTWSLVDDKYAGIADYEINVARIGSVLTVRLNDDVDKRIMMLRVNVTEFEHMVIFDNTTIFNDIIYLPQYGLHQLRLKVYGNVTGGWNGRLEAPGFMVVDDSTLPNFEKLVNDFEKYYDGENPTTSVELNDLSRHAIGFQTREYLRRLILNERNQLDFYKGFIKEKGTLQAFDKVLRTSKSIRSTNYKVLEEWAFKVGEFGAINNDKRLEFNVLSSEMSQEPQMFHFDEAMTEDNKYDSTITYFGKQGVDSRWITRNNNNMFPTIKVIGACSDVPNVGPFTTKETDIIAENIETFTPTRVAYQNETGKVPSTALIVSYNGSWDYAEIVEIPNTIMFISPATDMGSTQVVFKDSIQLNDGERFFIESTEVSLPTGVRGVGFYYTPEFGENTTLYIPGVGGKMNVDFSKIKLYAIRSKYGREVDRTALMEERNIDVANIRAFNRPVIYNTITQRSESYLALWDPRQCVIPGIADAEVSYKTMFDPALYNFMAEGSAAWGADKVGTVWWDTSRATYVNYHQPIRVNGKVDAEATRQYRRDNWGRLLPGGEIAVYEWVRSPVHPVDWEDYVAEQNALNKSTLGWVPTGEAYSDKWCEHDEYDAATTGTKRYYYFWVRNPYSVPSVPSRKLPVSEITRIITSPQNYGQSWFAPISQNEFIVGGIRETISSENSVLQIRYKEDVDNSGNIHKEWKLFKEGDNYNFDSDIWGHMCDSIVGERVVDADGNTAILEYPNADLGNEDEKTWFRDVTEARREFVALANSTFKNTNILANSVYVNTILNYAEKESNPYTRNAVVVSYNGEYVLRIPRSERFSNLDAVMFKTDGVLPTPFLENGVYFVEKVKGKTDLFTVKEMASASTPITIVTKGMGSLMVTRVEDLNRVDASTLDMTKYWNTIDWYAVGYSSNTPYIEVPSLEAAEKMYLAMTDIVKVNESDTQWSLYIRDYSRDVPIWKTVGRKGSTIALNSKLYDFTRTVNGEFTAEEILAKRALRKLFDMFEGIQSHIVFGMVYYVAADQKVVDWVFKTSYIHVIGIDKALASKTVSLTDSLADVMEYFNEVKPYRTKIRAAMDQRTSDSDSLKVRMNDIDPDEEQRQLWMAEAAKPEKDQDFSKIKCRFREAGTMLFFDNTQEKADANLKPYQYYEQRMSSYLKQYDNDVRLPEEITVSGCPNSAYNGTYIEILDVRLIPIFDTSFAYSKSNVFIDRTKKIYSKTVGTVNMYAWNQVGFGWHISAQSANGHDWYYEDLSNGGISALTINAVNFWKNANKKPAMTRDKLNVSISAKVVVPNRVNQTLDYVMERLLRDTTVIDKEVASILFAEISKYSTITKDQALLYVRRFIQFTMDGTMYYDIEEFKRVCLDLAITDEQVMMKIIYAASEPIRDIMTYLTYVNRLKMYNPGAPDDYIDTIVESGFKGRQISNNPNSRLQFGYSSSTDESQNGYNVWSSEIYEKIRDEMRSEGYFESQILQKIKDYGYGNLISYVPYGTNTTVTKSIHISDPAGLNDVKVSESPLHSTEMSLNEDGYVDDLGAYDNLGYEKQSVAVKFENVDEGQYIFNVHELKLIDDTRSKFAVTIGKYQPEKTEDVDYGIYQPGGKIQLGSTKGMLDVDYVAFSYVDPDLFSWDFGSQYGQSFSNSNGSFSVEGLCIRDPLNPHRLVVSAPRTIKAYTTEWMKDIASYPAAERCLYPFGLMLTATDVASKVTQLRIGKHDFKNDDSVLLLSNDRGAATPTGAQFDEVTVLYKVKVIDANTISLYSGSGSSKTNVVLNTAVLPVGAEQTMKYYSMFRINPLKAKNDLTVDVFNYDAYYNRFLSGGVLMDSLKRNSETSILCTHGLKTGDRVQFTNIEPTYDIGQLKNHTPYYMNVLTPNTFQVMKTVDDAISGANPMQIKVDISKCTLTCINYWLTSTVSTVRKADSWHYNYNLLTPEARIKAMQAELNTNENSSGVEVVDQGFARPLIDKGSLRDKVRMQLQEHLSITVYQDDRKAADSSKVYDSNGVHMYNTYTSGAAPYAYRIETGHGYSSIDVTVLGDEDVFTLSRALWYYEDEIHVKGIMPVKGVVKIGDEYIEYKSSTTYRDEKNNIISKLSKLIRGYNYTQDGFLYLVGEKVIVAYGDKNETGVIITRSNNINPNLYRKDYAYSTEFIYTDTNTANKVEMLSIKDSKNPIAQKLRSRKATYKGQN